MDRIKSEPRKDWQKIVESQGLHYHTLPNHQPTFNPTKPENTNLQEKERVYWDENAYYQFSSREVDEIEECTYWLNKICLEAVDYIIENELFEKVGVPASHIEWIKQSWDRDEHTIYGRFDLWYNGDEPPKLLEYNADTPTGLIEAAVIQWKWLKDTQEFSDQYNSIHEKLIDIFKILKDKWEGRFYFAALAQNLEDFMTVNYLRDTAIQAGWDTEYINIEDIGWDGKRERFVDAKERMIFNCFKLYPWEWMVKEEFGQHLLKNRCRWLEAPWKSLLSNKGLLAILSELYPKSEYLLQASFEPLACKYIKKPIHGREGANVEVVDKGVILIKTEGPYKGPFVYQEFKQLPNFDGNYPVIGSWMVNGFACGIGIREDTNPITQNTSRFVPHIFS